MILGKESAALRRFDASTRDPDTGRTIEPTPTTSTFQGSFQPLNGEDRDALPEGVRASDTKKVYTKTELRTADQHAGTSADEVDYDGKRFTVYEVKRYPKLIPHYRALLIRQKED